MPAVTTALDDWDWATLPHPNHLILLSAPQTLPTIIGAFLLVLTRYAISRLVPAKSFLPMVWDQDIDWAQAISPLRSVLYRLAQQIGCGLRVVSRMVLAYSQWLTITAISTLGVVTPVTAPVRIPPVVLQTIPLNQHLAPLPMHFI